MSIFSRLRENSQLSIAEFMLSVNERVNLTCQNPLLPAGCKHCAYGWNSRYANSPLFSSIGSKTRTTVIARFPKELNRYFIFFTRMYEHVFFFFFAYDYDCVQNQCANFHNCLS